jgi:ankyrin repeat protein
MSPSNNENVCPITLRPISPNDPVGYMLNRKRYDVRELSKWVLRHNTVPHSRRQLSSAEVVLIYSHAHRLRWPSLPPLIDAAMKGHTGTVSRLLDGGADIEVRFRFPSHDDTQWMEGLDPLHPVVNNGTALLWAALYGQTATVKLLLQRGAWVSSPGAELVRAVYEEWGSDENFGIGDGSVDGYPNMTALMLAAMYGHVSTVRALLDGGANVNASRQPYGLTALLDASEGGHAKTVKLLLDRGANVNSRDKNGAAPLTHASALGNEQIVKLLLDRGAGVNSRDKNGATPLMHASGNGKIETVRVLLNRGATVTAVDARGRTAAVWAWEYQSPDVYRTITQLLRLADIQRSVRSPLRSHPVVRSSRLRSHPL